MAKDDNLALKAHEARRKAKEDSVADFYARQENLQPKPTQEENDLAKLGQLANDDEKEDDGSEWQEDADARVMTARLPSGNPYQTRELNPETGEPQPRRR